MPSLSESTPPTPPPNPEEIAFRHTLLYRFEDPTSAQALQHLGRVFADYLDETGQWGTPSISSVTAGKLQAVAADLRELEAFVDQLRCDRFKVNMESHEERLAHLAEGWFKKLGELARSIEKEVCA
jgi:hypothetical protein